MVSKDGLNVAQANKFAECFGLENLRLQDGYWVADDHGEPYTISKENYDGAWHDGDLSD